MNFHACAVIPVFNHHACLDQIVAALLANELPCILVDDGSDQVTKQTLKMITASDPRVECLTLPQNRGKGAAVMAGIVRAGERGFTHALQIDADGQHDLADVPAMLTLAQKHPQHLISGAPRYDSSVPAVRFYGRYINHAFVWLETLSLQLQDSMCGYRVYPLAPVLALSRRVRIGRHMDFDAEIMVRLYWDGIDCLYLPTKVHYPAGGISHFRMFRDNAHIVWNHTRLLFAMLPRIPALLRRNHARRRERHWAELNERGSAFGMRILTSSYTWFGRRLSHLLMLPVVGYFFITHPQARRASRQFLTAVGPYTQPELSRRLTPSWGNVLRHFWGYAVANLDVFAAWHDPRHMRVSFPESEQLVAATRAGRGMLLISAHIGNLEMTRALATLVQGLKVNALVYTEHARKSNSVLAQANDAYSLRLIHVQELGPEIAVLLREKVAAGEAVVIVGDRTPVSATSPVVQVEFLGRPAPFAVGPYILAHLLECPVYLFFCVAEQGGYTIHLEPFAESVHLPRHGREATLQALAGRYAIRLADYAARFPLQWYNFYDFWADRRAARHADAPLPTETSTDAQRTRTPV
jgi:predicted LPLAT superfamily acyltransferase